MLVMRRLFLIDGVAVPKIIWNRRKEFGEHREANYRVVDIPSHRQSDLRRRGPKGGQYYDENAGSEKYKAS
jgi:hypothetical protein